MSWRRGESEKLAMINLRKKDKVADTLCRSLSKCLDPQEALLEALKREDEASLMSVMSDLCPIPDDLEKGGGLFPLSPKHWVNQPLDDEHGHKSVLHLALEKGNVSLVNVLLNAGVRADSYNEILGLSPIHVAVSKGDLSAVKTLLNYMADAKRLNVADLNGVDAQGRTCLHLAVEQRHLDILHYICQSPTLRNVDARDLKGRRTPLFVAASNANPEAAEILLAHGANPDIKCLGRSVREVMQETLAYFDLSKVKRLRDVDCSFDEADHLGRLLDKAQLNLKRGLSNGPNLVEFNVYAQHRDAGWLGAVVSGEMSLMQKACDYGLKDHVNFLIERGINPNLVSEQCSTPPIILAAYNGHAHVLETLKQTNHTFLSSNGQKGCRVLFSVSDTATKETVLHSILKRSNPSSTKEQYQRSLDLILDESDSKMSDDIANIINRTDAVGNAAIHYAIVGWDECVVRKLLELGSNVGMRNVWEETPIKIIKPETLESFLNDYCLKYKNDVMDDDFELEFNYSFLAPPTLEEVTDTKMEEIEEMEQKPVLPETETLWYLSRSEKHRHLLKHPVVNSFLCLKWNKIRPYFNRNLRFYLLLVTCLTWYIFERYGGLHIRTTVNTSSTSSFCSELSSRQSTETLSLFYYIFLLQSLVQVFMMIGDWRRDCMNCSRRTWAPLFFAGWLESLTTLIMLAVIILDTRALWTSVALLTLLLLIRELLQMSVSMKRYLLSAENWLELSLVLLISSMLFLSDDQHGCDLQRHLAAVAILFSWAELITLVARHPSLHVYTVYVNMFYKVLSTFFGFLLWYSFFVIAFALGFYIMLHKDTENELETDKGLDEKTEEEKYDFFNYPWLTLVKTTTMFIGEIEFADIPVDLDSSLALWSYLFLLAFILLIVVVLMNLLNGLAISDTGAIRENAEIVAAVARVENISYIESLLLGDPFDFLSNWPPIHMLSCIPSLGLCRMLHKTRIGKHVALGITGATGILVFYSMLKEKRLVIRPNRRVNNNCFNDEESNLKVAKDIVDEAKAIVVNRQNKDTNKEDHMERLEAKIVCIEDKLDVILKALNNRKD